MGALSGSLLSFSGGKCQPARSNSETPYWIGTAKFEASFSVNTAKLTPITRPLDPNTGAPMEIRQKIHAKIEASAPALSDGGQFAKNRELK